MSVDHVEEMNRVHTNASVAIPNELFEKIYLNPRVSVKGELRKTFANPTPMSVYLPRNQPFEVNNFFLFPGA